MLSYSHRQSATVIRVVMGATALFVAIIGGLGFTAAEDRGAMIWLWLAVMGVMALLAWVFGGLTVTLDESAIDIQFGPGWPRKRIALADVRGAEPVRNSWWYGWGIRLTPHGWMWNVSGLDAVEVLLADGRRTRIGTDEPRELAAAIHQAIGV